MREWNIGENSDDHRRPNLTIFLKKIFGFLLRVYLFGYWQNIDFTLPNFYVIGQLFVFENGQILNI